MNMHVTVQAQRNWHNSPWTIEKIEELRTLWAAGHSMPAIASQMDMTRSSIKSKINRLELPPPLVKIAVKKSPSTNPALAEQIAKDDLSSTALHVSFLDLEQHQCRFAYGDEPSSFTFCGHHKKPGSSYCAGHTSLCCARR